MKSAYVVALFYLFVMVSCSAPSFEQSLHSPVNPLGLAERIDSIVINAMNRYNIPGLSVAVVRTDSVIHLKGYGQKDINENALVSAHAVFHTASISKLFTAVAIMHLVQKGEIRLIDKLSSICPDLNYDDPQASKITIASLLNHTSGLPDVGDYHWERNNQSNDALEDYLKNIVIRTERPPLENYHYSNLGYDILGYIVQKVTGQYFEDFVKNSILLPSNMPVSDFRYYQIPDSMKVTPHTKNRLTRLVEVRTTYPYTREHGPSSTLNSSASELANWMIYFLRNLKTGPLKETYEKMIRPSHPDFSYIGLGFQLGTLEGWKKIGHYGGDKGFRSYLLMIPEKGLGLVLLANCDYNEDFRQEILHPIGSMLLSQ